jgi:hypothetical protein
MKQCRAVIKTRLVLFGSTFHVIFLSSGKIFIMDNTNLNRHKVEKVEGKEPLILLTDTHPDKWRNHHHISLP